jgi:hypothetical protein
MAVMMGSLYAALVKAGAGEDDAKKAAEEVANFELRLNSLEAKIDRLEAKMDVRFSSLEARITVLFWMIGLSMAMNLAVLGVLLRSLVVR